MRKILIVLLLCCITGACGVKKPPLSPTQVVNGKSIIIPPEFDTVPELPPETENEADKKEK